LPAAIENFYYHLSKMRMKPFRIIYQVLLLIFFSINIGCEQPLRPDETTAKNNNDIDKLSFYALYAPSKIDIMPLTEFVRPGDVQQSKVNIYVSLLDSFGSQIKSPGIFRFELYEHIPRSAKSKGKRAVIWPDVDLIEPVTNNDHWRDFLRAYEFSLPCELAGNHDYILQITCLCPNGKRLSTEFTLRQTK
jgi:hypothetical protein